MLAMVAEHKGKMVEAIEDVRLDKASLDEMNNKVIAAIRAKFAEVARDASL